MLQLEKVYSGYRQTPVIRDISFEVAPGELVALVGLNGAGKSTLLKTILGLLQQQSGQVRLNGVTRQENHQLYTQQIAYIPETPILYEGLTLRDHLAMTALGYQIPLEVVMERALPLLRKFRLEQQLEWFPVHFSKGMKQKVMIVCALVTGAPLLVIDEPFLGLDPLAIRDFSTLLQQHITQGGSVLLTTHVFHFISEMATRYLMLHQGEIRVQGQLADLRDYFQNPNASLDELYIQMAEMQV